MKYIFSQWQPQYYTPLSAISYPVLIREVPQDTGNANLSFKYNRYLVSQQNIVPGIIYQLISNPLQAMHMEMINDYTFIFISFGTAIPDYLQKIIIFL